MGEKSLHGVSLTLMNSLASEGASGPVGQRRRRAGEEREGGSPEEEGAGGANGEESHGACQRFRHGGQDVWLFGSHGLLSRTGGSSSSWL